MINAVLILVEWNHFEYWRYEWW